MGERVRVTFQFAVGQRESGIGAGIGNRESGIGEDAGVSPPPTPDLPTPDSLPRPPGGDGPDDRPYVVVWRRYTEGLLRLCDYGLGDGAVPAVPGVLLTAYEADLDAVEDAP